MLFLNNYFGYFSFSFILTEESVHCWWVIAHVRKQTLLSQPRPIIARETTILFYEQCSSHPTYKHRQCGSGDAEFSVKTLHPTGQWYTRIWEDSPRITPHLGKAFPEISHYPSVICGSWETSRYWDGGGDISRPNQCRLGHHVFQQLMRIKNHFH